MKNTLNINATIYFDTDKTNVSKAILETLEDIPREDMSGLVYKPMRKRGN